MSADANCRGDSQTLPNGMGRICWLTKIWPIGLSFGLDVFAGGQRISALLKCVITSAWEVIGVQEARYLIDAMEKLPLSW